MTREDVRGALLVLAIVLAVLASVAVAVHLAEGHAHEGSYHTEDAP